MINNNDVKDINTVMAVLLAKDLNKIPYTMFEIVSKAISYIVKYLLEEEYDETNVDTINTINIAAINIC